MSGPPRRPRVRDMDDDAVWREVIANVGLVHARVRRHVTGAGVEYDDLVQEGMLGLYRAVERFDPALGFTLSTYATRCIEHRILRTIAGEVHPVHVPHSTLQRVVRGRDPGPTGHDRILAAAALVVRARTYSDQTAGEGEGLAAIPARAATDPEDRPDALPPAVVAAIAALPDRDRFVLRARFGIDGPEATLRDLAALLGVSVERVRQIEERALAKVREHVGVGS